MQDKPLTAADDNPDLASGAAMEALFPHPDAVIAVAPLSHGGPDSASPDVIDSLFIDPAEPEEVALPGFTSVRAVVASIGLHGVIACLLLVGFVGAKAPGPVLEPPGAVMRVSTVRSNPQRATRPQASPASTGSALVSERPLAPVPAVEPAPPASEPAAVAPMPQTAGTASESPVPPELDGESIGAAVEDYVRSLDGELTRDWVAECLRYRNRYPTRECPQQMNAEDYSGNAEERALVTEVFDALSAAEDAARRREEMEAESNALRELMEEDTLLGAMARQRYYLNLLHFAERDPRTFGTRGTRPEGDVINLLSVGTGGMGLFGGLMEVERPGVTMAPLLQDVPFPDSADAMPAGEDEADPDALPAFKPLPPLFPLR